MAAAAPQPVSISQRVGPGARFTRMPHEFADCLHRKVSGMAEYWVHVYVQRMSVGIGQEKTEALSYKSLAEAGGFGLTSIVEAIQHALKIKTIGREKVAGKREYRYWTQPENWRHAPDYEPPEVEEDESEEEQDNTAPPVISRPDPKASKGEDSTAPPVIFRSCPGSVKVIETSSGQSVETVNESREAEFEFSVQEFGDGRLRLGVVLAEERPAPVFPFPDRSTSPPQEAMCDRASAARSGADALRDFLLPKFDQLGELLDRKTALAIWGALQKSGASLAQYVEHCEKREARGKMSKAAYLRIAQEDMAGKVAQKREIEAKGLKANAPAREPSMREKVLARFAEDER